MKRSNDSGYSLVELMVSIVIVGVLASQGLSVFYVTKTKAEYVKAVWDMANAKKAFEDGIQYLPSGYISTLAYTTNTGGPVPPPLSTLLPGAATSPDVKLGAEFSDCDPTAMGMKQYIESISCRANKKVIWFRLCNGVEVELDDVAAAC